MVQVNDDGPLRLKSRSCSAITHVIEMEHSLVDFVENYKYTYEENRIKVTMTVQFHGITIFQANSGNSAQIISQL